MDREVLTVNPHGYLKEYKKIDISTANREALLLMLYDGAIRFINRARTKILEGNMSEKRSSLSSAIAIITELMETLNIEIGGEIAENLERLYLYMNEQLINANLKNDAALLDEVTSLLTTLRDGWNEAINDQKAKQVAENKEMAMGANRL